MNKERFFLTTVMTSIQVYVNIVYFRSNTSVEFEYDNLITKEVNCLYKSDFFT